MENCRRYIVSGKVQGVFYRASAQQQATDLGLQGYAQNLANGSVEVVICGEQAALDKMLSWLKCGPIMANVASVQQVDCAATEFAGFETR